MKQRTSISLIFGVLATAAAILLPVSYTETAVKHDSVFAVTGDGRINLVDVHTSERLSIVYRDGEGIYDESAIMAIDRTLRCHGDQDMLPISLKLIEFIDHLQDNFGADIVDVVSGYRSPEYNEGLRRTLRRVAKESFHIIGMAMDIRLPGVEKSALGAYARSLAYGGVGVYRSSGFVHIDVGPVRSW